MNAPTPCKCGGTAVVEYPHPTHRVASYCAGCGTWRKWGSYGVKPFRDRIIDCLRRFDDAEARALVAEHDGFRQGGGHRA